MLNTFASNLKSRTSPYEKKILELRGLIQTEAKNYQNVLEAKDIALKEIKDTREEKSRIEGVISKLEKKQAEAEEALKQTIEKKTAFVESTKVELKKEKKALKETTDILSETSEKVSELMPVVKEIEKFLSKESDARERFLRAETIFITAKEKTEKIVNQAQKEKAEVKEKHDSFEGLKTYVTKLYGKLAIYVKVATETLEYVNETLEKKEVPLRFEIPEGEKILKVGFDNFNKQKDE